MSTLYPTLAAVLWDFDGTLADTEPLWIEAEYELIGRLGGTWSEEQANELVGNSLIDSGIYILNAIDRRDLDPAWVVDQLITRVVEILRDRFGVPHIYADSIHDLFFGYGYAVAEDRLFQLEMAKRSVNGTVAEVLGLEG